MDIETVCIALESERIHSKFLFLPLEKQRGLNVKPEDGASYESGNLVTGEVEMGASGSL